MKFKPNPNTKLLFSICDIFQKRLHDLLGDQLFNPFPSDETHQDIVYFHSKCSKNPHSFVPVVWTLKAKACHDMYKWTNPSNYLRISLVRTHLHSENFFQTATIL